MEVLNLLKDINNGIDVTRMPHERQFEALRKRLSDEEFNAIVDRINELIEKAGGEIATAGWLPGNDWTGTPFLPIYEKAARRNRPVAGMFFGQLVWYAIQHRDETWGFGRFEKDGVESGSMTYFRLREDLITSRGLCF